MNDDPLSRRDEFLLRGIPRDLFMYYARKAHELRQQAFRDTLGVILRYIGFRWWGGKAKAKKDRP